MHSKKYVAYYRVSTARQGLSGLGLDAQRSAVAMHIKNGSAELIYELTEIESGKRSDRPKLLEALTMCRLHNADLIIAKLDRLARNVAFISNLMEAGVNFEAVDFPQANRLTLHILAAVAEHEAKTISDRTRAALASAKNRGTKLGGFRGRAGTAADCEKARLRHMEIAARRNADIAIMIRQFRREGKLTNNALAESLNNAGISAPRGGKWKGTQVRRVVLRTHHEFLS